MKKQRKNARKTSSRKGKSQSLSLFIYNDQFIIWICLTLMYIWIPLVTNILSIITFSFYDLDKIHPQIIADLEERSRKLQESRGKLV